MPSTERLRCAACGKTTRARNADILQGWYSGPGGAKYCSSECTRRAPKPKGRGRNYFVRWDVPDGTTSADVDRWREHVAKVFAKLAADAWVKEQEEAFRTKGGVGAAREFQVSDYEQVRVLWNRSEGIVLTDADKRPAITKYIRRNPGLSFVWEVDGAIVGAVLAGSDGRRGFLHHLAVAPEHRRHGIGRALVETAMAALAKTGVEKVHLMVLPAKKAARQFWKSLGWVERTDLVLMSKVQNPGATGA